MRKGTHSSKRRSSSGPNLLVSRSTILILSGILIGTGVGHGMIADGHVYAFAAGVIGLCAFVGLDSHARHREHKSAQKSLQRAIGALENRLDRHIPGAAERIPAGRKERALVSVASRN